MNRLFDGEEEAYNRAGDSLVDVVSQMEKDKLSPHLGAHLLLDKAVDLCFHVLGHDDALKMIDAVTRDHIANKNRDQN